jgi:hypothetical protein
MKHTFFYELWKNLLFWEIKIKIRPTIIDLA